VGIVRRNFGGVSAFEAENVTIGSTGVKALEIGSAFFGWKPQTYQTQDPPSLWLENVWKTSKATNLNRK
jgi:hypothetical protein